MVLAHEFDEGGGAGAFGAAHAAIGLAGLRAAPSFIGRSAMRRASRAWRAPIMRHEENGAHSRRQGAAARNSRMAKVTKSHFAGACNRWLRKMITRHAGATRWATVGWESRGSGRYAPNVEERIVHERRDCPALSLPSLTTIAIVAVVVRGRRFRTRCFACWPIWCWASCSARSSWEPSASEGVRAGATES